MLDETREMTRNTKPWRAAVAKQLGVTIPVVKKGVQALLFGMNSKKWRRGQGIPDNIRSPSFDRLEKEIKEARMLITDDEIKAGRASPGDKPAKILSRTVEKSGRGDHRRAHFSSQRARLGHILAYSRRNRGAALE